MSDEAVLELGQDECWTRLAAAPFGRIAVGAGGQVDIFPVNHRVHDGAVLFRTAAGTKLLELTIHDQVAFEVDGVDGDQAFSVVVKGRAEQLEQSAALEDAASTGLRPWSAVRRDRWVRIVPTVVTGRRFTIHLDGVDEVPFDAS